jgi:hypothetical protein
MRKDRHDSDFLGVSSVAAPTSSLEWDVFEAGTYTVHAEHTKPGYTDSDPTADATITVTIDGEDVT